jgi:hypothetical protein
MDGVLAAILDNGGQRGARHGAGCATLMGKNKDVDCFEISNLTNTLPCAGGMKVRRPRRISPIEELYNQQPWVRCSGTRGFKGQSFY